MRCGRCKQPIPKDTFLHDCEGQGLGADSYVTTLEAACAKSEDEMERLERDLGRYRRAMVWVFANGLPVVEVEAIESVKKMLGLKPMGAKKELSTS